MIHCINQTKFLPCSEVTLQPRPRPSKGLPAWHSPCHQAVPFAGTSRSQPPAPQPCSSLPGSATVAKAALARLSGSPAQQICLLIDSHSTQWTESRALEARPLSLLSTNRVALCFSEPTEERNSPSG